MVRCQPPTSSRPCLLVGMDQPHSQSASIPQGNKTKMKERAAFHLWLWSCRAPVRGWHQLPLPLPLQGPRIQAEGYADWNRLCQLSSEDFKTATTVNAWGSLRRKIKIHKKWPRNGLCCPGVIVIQIHKQLFVVCLYICIIIRMYYFHNIFLGDNES